MLTKSAQTTRNKQSSNSNTFEEISININEANDTQINQNSVILKLFWGLNNELFLSLQH